MRAPQPAARPSRRNRRRLWLAAAAAIGVLAIGSAAVAAGVAGTASEPTLVAATGSPSAPEHRPADSAPAPDASPSPPASEAPVAPPSTSADLALEQLGSRPVVSGRSDAAYDRDMFGQTWADVDRNGCDTRNDVLGADLLDPVFKPGTRDCKVLSGTLIDPYDGTVVHFVSGPDTSVLVQVDHVVALAWAWKHGAEYWSDEQRLAFANDPRNLVAASAQTNQAKRAFGPSEWLPSQPELQCAYVENWTAVLAAYDLGISADDLDAARAVLEEC